MCADPGKVMSILTSNPLATSCDEHKMSTKVLSLSVFQIRGGLGLRTHIVAILGHSW